MHYPEDLDKEDMPYEDIVDFNLLEPPAADDEVIKGMLAELTNCIGTHGMSEDEDM